MKKNRKKRKQSNTKQMTGTFLNRLPLYLYESIMKWSMSGIPTQVPSTSLNPSSQLHWNDPGVLMHLVVQGDDSHSSISFYENSQISLERNQIA